MSTWHVVVTCVNVPCAKCRSRGERGYFLSPVANGIFLDRAGAHADARRCTETTGKDGLHRYDVAEVGADGSWMSCPWCGEDELYSLAQPPSLAYLDGCYGCGRTLAEAAAKQDLSREWMGETSPSSGDGR